jgi:hypothetical protein
LVYTDWNIGTCVINYVTINCATAFFDNSLNYSTVNSTGEIQLYWGYTYWNSYGSNANFQSNTFNGPVISNSPNVFNCTALDFKPSYDGFSAMDSNYTNTLRLIRTSNVNVSYILTTTLASAANIRYGVTNGTVTGTYKPEIIS